MAFWLAVHWFLYYIIIIVTVATDQSVALLESYFKKKPSLAVKEKVGKKWVQAGFELVHTFDIAWKSPSLATRPSGQ